MIQMLRKAEYSIKIKSYILLITEEEIQWPERSLLVLWDVLLLSKQRSLSIAHPASSSLFRSGKKYKGFYKCYLWQYGTEKAAFSLVVKCKSILGFMGHSLKVHPGNSRRILEITEQRWHMLSSRHIVPARSILIFCTGLCSSVGAVCMILWSPLRTSDLKRLSKMAILLSSFNMNSHILVFLFCFVFDSHSFILILIYLQLIMRDFTVCLFLTS